jgi:Zn-dependent M28 family amino/carboxypeptidase
MGSDHYPFMRKNVSAVFFITGMHDEYHRPEDTVARVLSDKVEKVTQLAFLTMWQAAELPVGTVLK